MALHMNLMVNGQQIGYLMAQRLEPVKPTGSDICRYAWEVNINGETRMSLDGQPLEHRFADGAWWLVTRVIAAAGFSGELAVASQEATR